jgi:hypothetical protein
MAREDVAICVSMEAAINNRPEFRIPVTENQSQSVIFAHQAAGRRWHRYESGTGMRLVLSPTAHFRDGI